MRNISNLLFLSIASILLLHLGDAQVLPRDQWGAPLVTVTHPAGAWVIAGKKNTIRVNESDLGMIIDAHGVPWRMVASDDSDMIVQFQEKKFFVRLADAGSIEIKPYDAGFKTGIKITLGKFHSSSLSAAAIIPGLALSLTVCLEGKDEDVVCDIAAVEHDASVWQLDWPKELDASDVDYTALSNGRGNLLPRNWPEAYDPINHGGTDKSFVESNLIECWSMSWWGFQKGKSAMVVIVETPDDAAYKFNHPAGGPTVIGPRWRESLGRLAYMRSVRFCFIPEGNYVTMAKRYRRYVMDKGQFVSLKEKIARDPLVAELIGTPQIRMSAKRNYRPGGFRYDTTNPGKNYEVTTFDERIKQLRAYKAKGIARLCVTLTGWPYMGYDRQHPDALPPAPEAGGWDGLKRWADACKELGYIYDLHDQYRDYYTDAPSFDRQFAIHEQDTVTPATAFPGTRFGFWKEGYLPFMDHWDGGAMTYLDARYALGHLIKNYQLILEHGIKTEGSYLDVFGYVPPTEDFNPEHPLTRAQCMEYRARCFDWVRANLGVVGTEAGSDWVIPYVDYTTDAAGGRCISVPLYELVYHDAVLTPEGGMRDPLRCLLNGAYPDLPHDIENKKAMDFLRAIVALHKRVALLEMTNHEFLDKDHKRERTTFSDGTTVTIDRNNGTYEVKPELDLSE
ncbi:MAG TPA: DUF5696 domain-containing protein [Bacteroidota bacterium]|nr:DUF5696 domain-containing protein [Bacteroidota bacterium]